VPQRLSPLEVSLLAQDTVRTPRQVGTVTVLEPLPGGAAVDHETLSALIESRLAYIPRYRQRVVPVPGRLAAPVWVDDDDFDLSFHVRTTTLPRPGTADQLHALVGQVLARRLDRARPLWEVHVVDGLEGGRVAVVEKVHVALVDGGDTVDLAQVLLDPDAGSFGAGGEPTAWHPGLEPGSADLVVGALWESAQDPVRAVDNLRGVVTGALGVALAVGEVVAGTLGAGLGEIAGDALRGGLPPAGSPLGGTVSSSRRFAGLRVPLADLQAVRTAHGYAVHDVVLAAVAGALRSWLLARGELGRRQTLRALVPVSVLEDESGTSSLGVQVVAHLQDLPVAEPEVLARLDDVARGSREHRESGRAVDAQTLTEIAGFAPATLHALGVRAAAETLRRPYDVIISNAPGPQLPLYAGGSRMTETFPVVPLSAGHLLAVGVTSYDGGVFFGLAADRDAVSDLDVLVQSLDDAVGELLATTGQARPRPARPASPAARRAAASKAAARAEAARRRTETPHR